ncbi:argininosuccinate lyase [Enterocloster bolteae]|uniref:Argininosuccinate lyase n=1 Tax=Enterocloster bolteae TaxID=208479 RepID=A0A414AYF3_9FIRM|nr:argininosuccinate lyase [Enterocloster bolteae]
MRKQTKLVAVLSTAALLAIGASMTSFAATGWAEEDGTWVYYNRDGERATDQWKKSGNNWYWLDSNGEMAIDQLIEDGDNYYYVDINGVMASNQWVAIDNEDAGEDDEPEHYWYYFQANGKALKNGDNDKVALKTVNGKKYAFDDEGKMLFGWVAADNAERLDDTDGDAFKEGDYYFGGEDDGAMTVGWLQMDITYDEATNDYEIAPVFNEDEDQSRWFYFKSNGKKIKAEDGDVQKGKTINGKKYEFDQYGAMTAEWSLDVESASKAGVRNQNSNVTTNSVPAKYAQQWRYFQDVENGARVSKGWFKVVAAEYLNYDKNNDDEDAWYYADGSGNLYAGEFKTIKGKKYAFRNDGRMVDGLKFIQDNNGSLDVKADDDDDYPFDTEDDFIENAPYYENANYKCYYFGDGDDGSMKTNKINIDIDGDKFNFYFEKSGSKKGAGKTGEKDDKYYQSGMLLKAGKDEKYQVVKTLDPTIDKNDAGAGLKGYKKLDDVKTFLEELGMDTTSAYTTDPSTVSLSKLNITKSADNIDELYVIPTKDDNQQDVKGKYFLVNTSGKVIDSKSRNKDGNDYYYAIGSKGEILAIYTEK